MLQCQSCQKHEATVHRILVDYRPDPEGGQPHPEVKQTDLCPACAKAAGIPSPAEVTSFPKMIGMLGKAFLKPAIAAPPQQNLACPDCGWTLRDFQQTSRFGCPKDYEIFADFVRDLLERLHGTNEHSTGSDESGLENLVRQMQDAIAAEQYEKAAHLRDQIRKLEEDLGLGTP